MMRGLFFVLVVVACSGLEAQTPGEITLVADEWCPYNCAPETTDPGYLIEITREVFEARGIRVRYVTTTWSRAIYGTRTGAFDGIIGTGRLETPDFVFPESEQGISHHMFYTMPNRTWSYKDSTSLTGLVLGVIENYSYGSFWNAYVEENRHDKTKVQIVSGDDPLGRNLKKLEAGRIDVLVEDENVMNYHLSRQEESPSLFSAGEACEEKIYVAFSPMHPEAILYAEMLEAGVKALRESGRLAQILSKYHVTDWK
ncbi:MAG: transporter substrate-binding domain-containing protein [Bacteroidales bacterium]